MSQIVQKRCSEWLASGGVRPTKQRMSLAKHLVGDGQDRHVCAESLYAAASKDDESSVSLATVYNTLRTFCEAGLLSEITVDGQKSYFDTRRDPHPHYYWEKDATLSDAPKDAVQFEALPEAPKGTEIARVDVVIRLRDKD